MRLPYEILVLFQWLLGRYLELCTAKIVVLMGRSNVNRFALVRPRARSFAVQGEFELFDKQLHGYAEYTQDDTKINRIFLVNQHPESWRFPVPSAKKLLLEHSLSAAMTLAFDSTRFVLPMPLAIASPLYPIFIRSTTVVV